MHMISFDKLHIFENFYLRELTSRIFKASAIVGACISVSACGERTTIDGQQMAMTAIGDFRSFNEKVSNIENVNIDLRYLNNKFRNSKICQDNGYSISPGFKNLMKNTEIIYKPS